jgi:hypothetical protein
VHGDNESVMYCTNSNWAFGPVIMGDGEHHADERMEMFVKYLAMDPRGLPPRVLERMHTEWLAQEKAQWEAEEEAQWKVAHAEELT